MCLHFRGKIIPNIYGLLKVIDGQHRLYAHDFIPKDNIQSYGLPFTIMDSLQSREEMVLFKSINTTAEEVNSNLVDIILYTMKDHETDRGIASSIICELAFEDEDWQKIFDNLGTGISDYDKNKKGIKIKIDNLVQPLIRKIDYELIKDGSKGYLNPESIEDTVNYGRSVLKEYFKLLKDKFKRDSHNFWYTYIRTRPGLRLSLLLLSTWFKKEKLRESLLEDLNLDGLVDKIYKSRKVIKDGFDESQGTSRGDEFLKSIAGKILS